MLDFSHITDPNTDLRVFRVKGTTWQEWVKPRGFTMCHMICIGSGAGGAGGTTGANGGGGGGAAAISYLTVPLMLLPDILYIQVALGGDGGAAGVDGSAGAYSYISDQSGITAVADLWLVSGSAVQATGGAAAGSGGTGSVSAATSSAQLSHWGRQFNVNVAGSSLAGGDGQPVNAGLSVVALATSLVTGGAGGGGSTNNGGDITGAGLFPTISGGAGSSSANAGNGASGITFFQPFMSCGGSGGGGATGSAHSGGKGGDGGVGSGGGGGGYSAGTGGGVAGAGGRGGDGLVIIQCW